MSVRYELVKNFLLVKTLFFSYIFICVCISGEDGGNRMEKVSQACEGAR